MARRLGFAAFGVGGATLAWMQRNFDALDVATPLPRGSRVLIVGGGIAGVTAAFEAARLGYRVRLIEQSSEITGPDSASWGNAGTLGISKQTSLNLSRVSTGIFQSATAQSKTANHPGIFFDTATLLDPCFWLWGACYLRSLKALSGPTRAASEHGHEINVASQQATFALAAAERLTTEADMRVDGRLTIKEKPAADSSTGDALATIAAREPHLDLRGLASESVGLVAEVSVEEGTPSEGFGGLLRASDWLLMASYG